MGAAPSPHLPLVFAGSRQGSAWRVLRRTTPSKSPHNLHHHNVATLAMLHDMCWEVGDGRRVVAPSFPFSDGVSDRCDEEEI